MQAPLVITEATHGHYHRFHVLFFPHDECTPIRDNESKMFQLAELLQAQFFGLWGFMNTRSKTQKLGSIVTVRIHRNVLNQKQYPNSKENLQMSPWDYHIFNGIRRFKTGLPRLLNFFHFF